MDARYSVPILIGLTVTGISAAYLLYLLLKNDEDDLNIRTQRIITSRPTFIELKVPQDCVGAVIGSGGSTIKDIQETSNTKIIFKRDLATDTYQVCVIQGNQEGAQLAESLIHSIIANQRPVESSEMLVPQHVCSRLIGRNGDTIRSISRASNAKIIVERSSSNSREQFRLVIIKGTTENIALAKSLIEEKVMEGTVAREKIQESLDRRSPRKKMGPQYLMSAEALEVEQAMQHNTECLVVTGKDGLLKVFVSAVEHPGRFWVQVVGPQAVELDNLVDELTEFYRQEENRECHALQEVKVDELVAAPFSHDDMWYRARVTEVTLDDYDVEDSLVAVYYLDFGDSDTRRKKDLCSLRADFLKLRYQAIECCLAGVKPLEGDWTNEAIESFADLCHVAQWRVLMARVDSYKERKQGEREGTPVPVVKLYDRSGTQDIFVAEELVKQGYATWEWDPAEDQQMNVGAQLGQPPTDSTEAASSGTEINTVVGVTQGQDVVESRDCKEDKARGTDYWR